MNLITGYIKKVMLRWTVNTRSGIYLVLLCSICILVNQQAAASDTTHTISASQWQNLKNEKPFDYKNDRELIKTPQPYKPNALQKFFMSLFKFLGSKEGTTLIWLFVICVVGFVLYKLFISTDSFLFGKNKKQMSDGLADMMEEENIATTNWEALLQQATRSNDLRLAVRYSYMWLLQLLQQRELIQYRTDKTNYEYYIELAETHYKQSFKQLSRQYEYTWYGKYGLPADTYNEYISLFMNVKKQLGS